MESALAGAFCATQVMRTNAKLSSDTRSKRGFARTAVHDYLQTGRSGLVTSQVLPPVHGWQPPAGHPPAAGQQGPAAPASISSHPLVVAPSQSAKPGAHWVTLQFPATQPVVRALVPVGGALQMFPHPPQLVGLVLRFVWQLLKSPAQSKNPGLHPISSHCPVVFEQSKAATLVPGVE